LRGRFKDIAYFQTDSFYEENHEKKIRIHMRWGDFVRVDHFFIRHIANQCPGDDSLQGGLLELSRPLR
jgi:hypothetical protein